MSETLCGTSALFAPLRFFRFGNQPDRHARFLWLFAAFRRTQQRRLGGREQYDWLEKTLAGSRAKYKFIFRHNLLAGDQASRGGVEIAGFNLWWSALKK